MKTYREWEDKYTNLDLDIYLGGPCKIDNGIYEHVLGFSSPAYHDLFIDDGANELFQNGEASFSKGELYYHMTFLCFDNEFFYLGEYPAFDDHAVEYYMDKYKLWKVYDKITLINNRRIIIVEEK